MSMHYDVGIMGGGVIGLTCAWRLAQAGARVVVFEHGKVGHEASWAAAGMLAAQCEMAHHPPEESDTPARAAMFDLCLQSRTMYADFADKLYYLTGIDVELSLSTHMSNCGIKPGILYVTTRGSDLALQSLERQRAAGLRVDSAPPFQEHAAVWLPDEGHVNNQHLVEALYQAAADAHVAFIPERVYLSFLQSEGGAGKATRVGLSGETTCDKVLVCAGAWSGEIENQAHDCPLPVTPVMGEMLSLRHVRARDKFLIDHIIYSSDVYLVPRRDGTLLVGATMRRIGFDKRVTVRGVNTLLNAACALVPELAHFELETQWAGLRPATPDGLPILGKAAGLENFYMATGHFRNGILLAPITGQLMADCILNGVEPPRAFHLQRFAHHAVESDPICASN
jgi:glycine oxidase